MLYERVSHLVSTFPDNSFDLSFDQSLHRHSISIRRAGFACIVPYPEVAQDDSAFVDDDTTALSLSLHQIRLALDDASCIGICGPMLVTLAQTNANCYRCNVHSSALRHTIYIGRDELTDAMLVLDAGSVHRRLLALASRLRMSSRNLARDGVSDTVVVSTARRWGFMFCLSWLMR
ncbi:hypothetical protein [Bradyrhizobium sp.]|uniref:hypothetical protein n=1 Tax=Bradyrhizobium sp. TaxID=376 RepID=UPI00261407D4|nr:hypothetical protein [Bradyrhizobium sp.]